ncbi:ribosomal protein S18-alanine N-acetyltransferase [Enterococcus sp. LJL99]
MLKKFNPFERILAMFTSEEQETVEKTVTILNENYTIRKITLNDIKDLLAIEREVYSGEMPWTKSAFVSELKTAKPNLYLLIEKEGKVIGFIGSRIIKNDGHITNLAVHTTYQGRGIATLLIKEVKKFAKQHECETMSLEVRLSNKNAQRLYRKMGFVSRAIHRNYYDGDKEDALEMVLDL